MYIKSAKLTFRLPYAGSLKEKRQTTRSLMDRTKNKFNASIAEVAHHDTHQTLAIGISLVAASESHAQACLDEIIRFMDDFIEASGAGELLEVEEV